jgi:hypothetical protein
MWRGAIWSLYQGRFWIAFGRGEPIHAAARPRHVWGTRGWAAHNVRVTRHPLSELAILMSARLLAVYFCEGRTGFGVLDHEAAVRFEHVGP